MEKQETQGNSSQNLHRGGSKVEKHVKKVKPDCIESSREWHMFNKPRSKSLMPLWVIQCHINISKQFWQT